MRKTKKLEMYTKIVSHSTKKTKKKCQEINYTEENQILLLFFKCSKLLIWQKFCDNWCENSDSPIKNR